MYPMLRFQAEVRIFSICNVEYLNYIKKFLLKLDIICNCDKHWLYFKLAESIDISNFHHIKFINFENYEFYSYCFIFNKDNTLSN